MPSNTTTSPSNLKQILENRRLLQRILLDMLIIILLIVPIIICEFVIEPFRRGFFCDDETIRYPFKGNTISPAALVILVTVPPVVVLVIGEYARQQYSGQVRETRYIFGYNITIWKTNSFKQFVYFLFGLLLTFDASEVAKYTIGRLRPHFIAVCQPQLVDGTTCYDLVNQHRYVENYHCLGTGYTVPEIRQIRLSFPSGHACLSFYAFIYTSLYLQKRMHWRRSDLARHFIQFSLIMFAWFISLSRIMDSWHHWSDVLVGALIGVVVALTNAKFISKFFENSYTELDTSMLTGLTRQDTSVTLNEVLETTPPPYMINHTSVNAFTNDTFCTKV